MSSNDIAILIACISGVVSLTAAFGVEWIRQRSNSAKLAQDKALEEVKDQLARGREAATKAEEAERLIAKYRDPLFRSAYDLQSRIYNVCRQDGFTGSYRGHQRAIGERMLVRTDGQSAAGPRYECMGYAAFVAAHEDPSFAKWFTRIGAAVEQLPALLAAR